MDVSVLFLKTLLLRTGGRIVSRKRFLYSCCCYCSGSAVGGSRGKRSLLFLSVKGGISGYCDCCACRSSSLGSARSNGTGFHTLFGRTVGQRKCVAGSFPRDQVAAYVCGGCPRSGVVAIASYLVSRCCMCSSDLNVRG